MILDATAGNRTMWMHKDCEGIVYIDIEKRLEVKPTLYASNEQTPFLDSQFDTIFYDPPHGWGKGHYFYKYPDAESFKKHWQGYGEVPRYYGWDKIKSRANLISHLYYAQKEFHRILKPDGLLWVKWNEVNIPLKKVLIIFNYWQLLLKLKLHSSVHTAGKQNTYWLCYSKIKNGVEQTTLG